MDRLKSPQIQTDAALFEVMIYNDLNPFRTIKRIHPKTFRWSSYHHYAYGKPDPLITEPPCYLNLGKTPEERQNRYQTMILAIIEHDWVDIDEKRKKKNYSIVYCIGDPQWVKKRYQTLRTHAKKIKQQRQEAQTKLYGT